MIVEERDHILKPGKLAAFTATYREHGLQPQLGHLATSYCFLAIETGELNHVGTCWSYESLDDQHACRARTVAAPGWRAYLAVVGDLLLLQTTCMLTPASFSLLR